MSTERIQWIVGLKGLLCVLICLYHFTTRYSERYGIYFSPAFDYGAEIGVTCFFIISGFFVSKNSNQIRSGIIRWLLTRYIKLYPSYFICLCFTFIILNFFPLPDRNDISFLNFIKDIIMCPYISGHIEHASWYVFALLRLFIISGLLVKFRLLDSSWFHFVFSLSLLGWGDLMSNIFVSIPFFMGVVLEQSRRNKLLSISYFFDAFVLVYNGNSYVLLISTILLFFLFNLNEIKLCDGIRSLLSLKIFLMLGTISYTWYLVHQNVGFVIIRYLDLSYPFLHLFLPYVALFFTFLIAFVLDRIPLNRICQKYLLDRIKC